VLIISWRGEKMAHTNGMKLEREIEFLVDAWAT
jgi:hypothetical protein